MMGLLDISIFMGNAHVVPGGLHTVVPHQRLVASRPVFFFLLTELPHRSAQMIRAMLLWHTADLPQGFFNSFRERLKGLAEADGSGFHIGVGEHKMIDHVS